MKKTLMILFIVFSIGLTACGQPAATEVIPTVVLDSDLPQNDNPAPSSGAVVAAAEVVPASQVELSFPLTGLVKAVEVRAGDQVAAGDTLAVLDTAILDARVAEAEANLLAAETQVRYLRRVGTDEEHQEAARADVDRAQASLDSARAIQAQATLTAPIAGTVASVDISPAETVVPGQIVIVIGDLSHFQIETTDLSERDVPSVHPGQPASIFIEALNADFNGTVVDIARQATTLGGDTVFKVTIELDEQPQGLYWGMSADVEIRTTE